MIKAYALRFHRWLTLLMALPLIAVIATGLVLSFEPVALQSKLEKPLTKADVLEYLKEHDPQGKATGLSLRTYEHGLTLSGVGEEGETDIDLRTGDVMADDAYSAWSDVVSVTKNIHRSLMFDLQWLVIASSFSMLVLAALGLLMGLPRLRNNVGGWHNLAAWITLPLVILSPLTGLAIAYGITLTAPPLSDRGERIPIVKAVEVLAEKHDLSNLTSLRVRGGRMVARVFVDGSLTNFVVTPTGLEATPRNWPRAIHEGSWSGILAPALNVIVSIVFIGLWITGLFIWVRRTFFRQRKRTREVQSNPALRAAE